MDKECLLKEFRFKAVRSGGPGGQNVNKVATKVMVTFTVATSNCLTKTEKDRIFQKMASKLTKEGLLVLHCDETRSQHKNRALGTERLIKILIKASRPAKLRKKTKPTKSAIEKRLKYKKIKALKKSGRAKPNINGVI